MLENNIGKLIIKIQARYSICPGRINAKHILILAILELINRMISKMYINSCVV